MLILLLLAQSVALPAEADVPGDFFVNEDRNVTPLAYLWTAVKRETIEIPAGSYLGFRASWDEDKRMNDAHVEALARVPHLSFVDIDHGDAVTSKGLAALGSMKSLRWLRLGRTPAKE